MTTLTEAARAALEALTNCSSEHGHRCNRCDSEVDEGGKVAEALRAALAASEVQAEPVAWMFRLPTSDRWHYTPLGPSEYTEAELTWIALYAHPPAPEQPAPAFDAAAFHAFMLRGLPDDTIIPTPAERAEQPMHALIDKAAKSDAYEAAHNAGFVEASRILGKEIEQLRAAIVSAPRVPQGWKLVPVEPTRGMIDAANQLPENFPPMKRVYAAMLAAAPQPEGDTP